MLALDVPALVAVSGGRDSVALLHWLVSQGRRHLIVCHLNHGLRGTASGQDAALVRRLAKRFDLPCEIDKAAIRHLAKSQRMSIETAAREARHEFLAVQAKKHGTPHVFMAHHAEDQAETVLANLCRGSGLSGLGGMKPEQILDCGLILHRPLLDWRRTEIDSYIAEHRLPFRDDSSNQSLAHRRNRLRHEALPLLADIFDRDITTNIVRCAQIAARDDAGLRQITSDWLKQNPCIGADGALLISPDLGALHSAIQHRIMREWLAAQSVTGIDHALIESAVSMLATSGPAKINLPGARHLRRKARRLWVTAGGD